MTEHTPPSTGEHETEKTPSAKLILVTSAVLIALWLVSWGLSSVDMGAASIAVALGIAVVKASLVMLVFMELVFTRGSVRFTIASAFAMLAVALALVFADVVARGIG